MKSSTAEILPIIGTAMGGGFYAGRINVDGEVYALIVAPKAEGEHKPACWNTKNVPGALSYFDGLANTQAMAEAGSKLAKWALGLTIGGENDWYLPSQDELEVIYRNLKPTAENNWQYGRSGLNVSALPPSYPYTADSPAQTEAELFRADGAEAFEPTWYWSSTQRAAGPDYAWVQGFGNGCQNFTHKDGEYRARAVRRLKI